MVLSPGVNVRRTGLGSVAAIKRFFKKQANGSEWIQEFIAATKQMGEWCVVQNKFQCKITSGGVLAAGGA